MAEGVRFDYSIADPDLGELRVRSYLFRFGRRAYLVNFVASADLADDAAERSSTTSQTASASGSSRPTLCGVSDNVDVEILDVTDGCSLRPAPCLRRSALRPSQLRLLGGRGPRLQGCPPSLVAAGPASAQARTAPAVGQPLRTRQRVTRSSLQSVRRPRGDCRRARLQPLRPGTRDSTSDAFEPEAPGKLRLLDRGRRVFGSYAKVLLLEDEPAVYAQFGPLSAYPRAQQVRELYPQLAQCTPAGGHHLHRHRSLAHGGGAWPQRLVADIARDLASRGFAAIEAYPDLTLDRGRSLGRVARLLGGLRFRAGSTRRALSGHATRARLGGPCQACLIQ